ncbi:hypothetical protein GOBAR_DD20791 [Gossypium barbadense]|nr:hypothetical protein GOBAR_DD20791 [Gossypium barbadense]
MNSCFNDEVVELLVPNSALDTRDNYKAFRVEDICKLMNDFYPNDFTEQEKPHMKIQLEHFQLDAHQSTELQKAYLVAYIEKEIARKFSTDSIIDEFDLMKKQRVKFRMPNTEK